jgi:hypothetical protein
MQFPRYRVLISSTSSEPEQILKDVTPERLRRSFFARQLVEVFCGWPRGWVRAIVHEEQPKELPMSENSVHYQLAANTASCEWWNKEVTGKTPSKEVKGQEVQAMTQELAKSKKLHKRRSWTQALTCADMEDFWILVPIVEVDACDDGGDLDIEVSYLDREPTWIPSYYVRAATAELLI